MGAGRLDRVAIVVADVDAVAADLESILHMPFQRMDVEDLGIRVGLGAQGLELVEKVSTSRLEQYWRGPMAALVIEVDDLDTTEAEMAQAGFHPVQSIVTAEGVRELFYGNAFHGLPLVLTDAPADAMVHGEARQPGAAPKVEWR
jgi:hypothetical protein